MPPRKSPAPVVLSLYTIYHSPAGYIAYKDRFVVLSRDTNEQHTHTASFTQIAGHYATLEEARASLPPWVSNTGRGEGDDESIVETWL